jgi:hypothetical protein
MLGEGVLSPSPKYVPTAHTSVAEMDETAVRAVKELLKLGDGTISQLLPSQCSVSAR